MNNNEKVGILFVHGILGTPSHFEPFLSFVPTSWTVCNLLLKGHGGSVKDFSKAKMSEWKNQVDEATKKLLETNDKIIIVAHSMGTLFAIREAINRPISKLFLLNTPLKVRPTFRLLKMSWKVFSGNIKDDEWLIAAKNAYSIEEDHNIFKYIGWIPRYIELFKEIRKTRKIISKLLTPTNIYLSKFDEMVTPKCSKIFKDNSYINLKYLETSGHFYYSPEDLTIMKEDFNKMIQDMEN